MIGEPLVIEKNIFKYLLHDTTINSSTPESQHRSVKSRGRRNVKFEKRYFIYYLFFNLVTLQYVIKEEALAKLVTQPVFRRISSHVKLGVWCSCMLNSEKKHAI